MAQKQWGTSKSKTCVKFPVPKSNSFFKPNTCMAEQTDRHGQTCTGYFFVGKGYKKPNFFFSGGGGGVMSLLNIVDQDQTAQRLQSDLIYTVQ